MDTASHKSVNCEGVCDQPLDLRAAVARGLEGVGFGEGDGLADRRVEGRGSSGTRVPRDGLFLGDLSGDAVIDAMRFEGDLTADEASASWARVVTMIALDYVNPALDRGTARRRDGWTCFGRCP